MTPSTLFDLPTTTATTRTGVVMPDDAFPGRLRDTGPLASALVGDGMGWFAALLTPTPPPKCVRCGSVHVYRWPAGFLLACPVCFPTEVTA